MCLFFFQAEAGIRDLTVTGVQTCALPIYWDWTRDNSPASSLWAEDFMGGNGRRGDLMVMTGPFAYARGQRSEEHTSELQSQSNLVCRLLLEKKNNTDVLSVHTSAMSTTHL